MTGCAAGFIKKIRRHSCLFSPKCSVASVYAQSSQSYCPKVSFWATPVTHCVAYLSVEDVARTGLPLTQNPLLDQDSLVSFQSWPRLPILILTQLEGFFPFCKTRPMSLVSRQSPRNLCPNAPKTFGAVAHTAFMLLTAHLARTFSIAASPPHHHKHLWPPRLGRPFEAGACHHLEGKHPSPHPSRCLTRATNSFRGWKWGGVGCCGGGPQVRFLSASSLLTPKSGNDCNCHWRSDDPIWRHATTGFAGR